MKNLNVFAKLYSKPNLFFLFVSKSVRLSKIQKDSITLKTYDIAFDYFKLVGFMLISSTVLLYWYFLMLFSTLLTNLVETFVYRISSHF